MQNSFITLKDPFHVHNVYEYPSWLERFTKPQPPQISALWHDVQSAKITLQTRDNADRRRSSKSRNHRVCASVIKPR
ncbi:MAG: hypothetical protein Q9P01_04790 [Anaerolineae bacterium]|nr:hypothetical protein [Anaerolineae bacterium]